MEFRQLRYFIAVAEELHFGRAAARLHVAQPALSQQVRNLERELGATLLERSRPLALTWAGEAVLDEARRTLRQADIAVARVQRAARGQVGRLTIGFLGSVAHELIPSVMTTFGAARPHVGLELEELPFDDQLGPLRSGAVDVAFVRLPLDDGRLLVEHLRDDPAVAIVASDHPLAHEPSIGLGALAAERWVFPPRSAWPAAWDLWQATCRRDGFTPELAATATSIEALVGLVAAGEGVAVVPATARALPRPGVAAVPIVDVTFGAAIVWTPERDERLVRDFVETAIEVARGDGQALRPRAAAGELR